MNPMAAVLAAALAVQSPPAPTPDTPPPAASSIPYAEIDGWEIMIDMDLGASCYVMGTFASGTTIRLGAERRSRDHYGYIVLANPKWKGISDGRDYDLSIAFDDGKPSVRRAHASVSYGIPALVVRFDDPAFARSLALGSAMTIKRDGTEFVRLDLASSQKAIARMATCQIEVDALLKDDAGAGDDAKIIWRSET